MAGTICIHGHFYQPSRENPWTGVIEREPSATPWHDWNDRITDECYRPNTAARILDGQGLIHKITNTYSRISYDFGPTLLSWLERERSPVYEDILRADALAQERFSRHGSALAHPYHHLIMPLLSRADKETEVRWGIRDFEDRFGRYPEGMWLPEMAVDGETLDVLADHGILFTLLSPHQGCRVRHVRDEHWTDTPGGSIDTTVPYLCRLPSGKAITVFFHHASLSSEVAFGDLLRNGDRFFDRLLSLSRDAGLLHFATDGETFGHHRPFGEMALGWCLDRIESSHPGTLTIYGEYLANHAPEQEVGIVERTSWSCPHGIRRWDEGCTCESGRHKGWSHEWRGPLHTAVHTLSLTLAELFGREAGAFFADPWSVRDDSIRIIRDSSPGSINQFFLDHASRSLEPGEREKALALLEMARQCLAMRTSCAWFFDDIADREAVQVLRHAARALQLASDLTGTRHEPAFIELLSAIKGSRPQYPDGGVVYRECVVPHVLSREKEAACLALLESAREKGCTFFTDAYAGEFLSCGEFLPAHDLSLSGRPVRYCVMGTGTASVLLGVSFTTAIPAQDISGYLLPVLRKKGYAAAAEKIASVFPYVFTPAALPPAGTRLALRSQLMRVTGVFDEAAGVLFDRYTGLFEEDQNLLSWYVLMVRMEQVLSSPVSTAEDLQRLAESFRDRGILPFPQPLQQPAGRFIKRQMEDFACHPEDRGRLAMVLQSLSLLGKAEITPPLWDLQNLFIQVRDGTARSLKAGAVAGDGEAAAWWEEFQALGQVLGVHLE